MSKSFTLSLAFSISTSQVLRHFTYKEINLRYWYQIIHWDAACLNGTSF